LVKEFKNVCESNNLEDCGDAFENIFDFKNDNAYEHEKGNENYEFDYECVNDNLQDYEFTYDDFR